MILGLIFLFLNGAGPHATAAGEFRATFQIEGEHAEYGPYWGQAVIAEKSVERMIVFKNFKFQKHNVAVVWKGEAKFGDTTPNEGKIYQSNLNQIVELNFIVRPSTYITGVDESQPYRAPAEGQQSVHLRINLSTGGETSFLKSKEKWLPVETVEPKGAANGNAGSIDLVDFSEMRTRVSAHSHEQKAFVALARKLGLDKGIKAYQAWVKNKGSVSEADSERVYDFTDFAFYRGNPQLLKITNLYPNDFAFLEALQKRNAFAQTLKQKARFFDSETEDLTLNEAGLLEIAHIDQLGEKTGSEIEGDAALWTGIYVWSQILRFKQEQDSKAMKNARHALKGLLHLLRISGNQGEFARTILKSPSNETISSANQIFRDRLHQGEGPYANYKWLSSGNNDMIKGLLIAFVVAEPYLKSGDQLRKEISAAVENLPQLNAVKGRQFNLGLAYGLKALYGGDPAWVRESAKFLNNMMTVFADGLDIDSGFYYQNIADWSGVHLSAISTLTQVFLAKGLEKNLKSNSDYLYLATQMRKSAEKRLSEMNKTYINAQRDFLTLLNYVYGADNKKDRSEMLRAKRAMASLFEIPAPRFVEGVRINHRSRPDWNLSVWPKLPWKFLKGPGRVKSGINFEEYVQGTTMYPLFESLSWSSTYFWKDNPFVVFDQSPVGKRFFSVDYLMLYRVAKESGLVDDET